MQEMEEIVTMPIITLAEYAAAFFENIDLFKNSIEIRNFTYYKNLAEN